MVSNGAYMLDYDDWKLSSHIRIVKNPHYWNAGQVAIDAVMFDPTENLATVLKRYRWGVRRRLWRSAERSNRLAQAKHAEGAAHRAVCDGHLLRLQHHEAPFNDRRVRQALAMAINREVLADKIARGGKLPAYGFVPDGIANYISQKVTWAGMSQADRDAAAIKLMSEAGYGPRKPLNVQFAYATSENRKQIAVAMAAMWKKLGVNVELMNTEQTVLTNVGRSRCPTFF
jgi:oligopeptide transport system substrate-binding protein